MQLDIHFLIGPGCKSAQLLWEFGWLRVQSESFFNISFPLFTSAPWLVVLTCGYARANSTYLDSAFRLNVVWHLRVSFYHYFLGMVIYRVEIHGCILEFCCKVFRIWFLHQICVLNLSSYLLIFLSSWNVVILHHSSVFQLPNSIFYCYSCTCIYTSYIL